MALQGMKLQENEEQKDEKHVRNLMRKNPYVTGAESFLTQSHLNHRTKKA